ncbi:hypothetical protein [Patulibacter sp.]|uniref:hypothetical protein n=1 Tax=Patulibacter sp. TaxID=1912859 RepID=UPI0027219AED|nr:hypothetical protein [Patulibacter sp.]MDO9409407.1 hypothetical protein [Patulibacter sp.]
MTAADSTTTPSDADLELEEWVEKAAARSVRRVRIVGALATGAAFLAVLIVAPSHSAASTWGLALLAGAAVVVLCNVAVRISARPDGPAPGRLTGDYLVLAGGGMIFAILGYPVARLLGLLSDNLY